MLRLSFIIAILVLKTNLTHAQDVPFEINSSEVTRDKLTQRAFGINAIGKIGNLNYYLFLPYQPSPSEHVIGPTGKYRVGKFDSNLNLVKKEVINLLQEPEKKEKEFEGILIVKGKLVIFSSFQNQKDKKHYFFMQNMNSESLAMEPNLKLAGELDYSGYSKYSRTIFTFATSPDESKILIFYTLLNKDNETLRTGLYVYDSDLKLKWKKDQVIAQFTSGVFGYNQFKVDNDGIVYLLGEHYADKENYFDGAGFKDRGFFSKDAYYTDKPNYVYHLYRYSDSGAKEDLFKLSIPEKFIRNVNFFPVNRSNVLCTGVYSAPGTISAMGGFNFNLNVTTNKVSNLNIKEFGADLISQGLSEAELRRFKRSIDNKGEWDPFEYRIGDVKTKSNGEKYFVAEQYIGGTKRERNGNTIVYSSIHLHKDLFIFTMSGDNQIKRVDKISKEQYMLVTSRFNSYSTIEKGGVLYFMFNTFEGVDGMFKNVEVGDSYIVSLTGDGAQKKSVIKKKDQNLPIPMPGTAVKISDYTILFALMSPNIKDYQFQKLQIN